MGIEDIIKTGQRKTTTSSKRSQRSDYEPNKAGERYGTILRVVRDRLTKNREISELNDADRQDEIRDIAWKIIEDEAENQFSYLMLSPYEKGEILEKLMQTMFGLGVIEPLINDPGIKEIMINGPERIFIERKGTPELALDKKGQPLSFGSNEELLNVIEKIVSPINRKVDESDPIVDARLPDGSRVNVVINPISLDGPAVTIRKFPDTPYSLGDLVSFGAMTAEIANLLAQFVKARYNILISGGTGTGKTTFLNALSMEIPPFERLVTVEDAAELRLIQAENLVRLETRPPNIEGKGAITMRELVRTALRMRPDRIIVGEVRGGEALDMLQAMNTGHDGSITTGHANSAADMLSRLETMVLMAGMELPVSAIRQQIVSAVEIIVHLSKFRDGSRRIVQISEILDYKNNEIITQELYNFHYEGIDKEGRVLGSLLPTGKPLLQIDKFLAAGMKLPESLKTREEELLCLS